MPGPDAERGASLLEGMWREVLAGTITVADSEVDGHIKESVATLIESNTVALRYCLPTQLLGKLTDSSLDTLCLQRGEGSESQWDQDGVLVYAVEVKERSINVADLRSFENKLNRSEVTEALISAPAVQDSEADAIGQRIRLMWGRGIKVYRLWIPDLVSVCMSLAGEQGRGDFIREVGKQLDQYGRTFGRIVWRDCLNEILDGVQPS